MLEFQQSEPTASHRVWMIQLTGIAPASEVPSGTMNGVNATFTVAYPPQYLTLNGQTLTAGSDYTLAGLTITMLTIPQAGNTFLSWYANPALTGQTGTGYISTNGAAAVATTNSLVEIDSTNMPGSYYIQLTQAEVSTLGFLSLFVKTASSNVFRETALITYNNPFQSTGGFAGGGSGKGLTVKQAQDIAERVWKVKLGEQTAAEILQTRSAFNPASQKVLVDFPDHAVTFANIITSIQRLENKDNGLEAILAAISGIKPTDYSKEFSSVKTEVAAVREKMKSILPDVKKFVDAIGKFQSGMSTASADVSETSKKVLELQDGVTKLQGLVEKFDASLEMQLDMDRRFAAMNSKMEKRDMEDMRKDMEEMHQKMMAGLKRFMAEMVNVKYQLLQELSGK